MSLYHRVCAVGLPLLMVAPVAAQESTDALQARIETLESRIAELTAETGDGWLTEQRADEIRSLVHDVIADADTRSSLLQSGMTSGYDGGFHLGSGDGNFSLKINGHMQTRLVFNNQDDAAPDDTTRWGFENTRTKLIFSGNVVDPTWVYRIEGDFGRSGGDLELQDAYIGKVLGNGWTVLAGQVKVPMTREFQVDSMHQLAVERSMVDLEYGARRTQGVALAYGNDQMRLTCAYADGHPASGGAPNAPWSAYDTEISLTARAELLLQGSWEQFADFTSAPGNEQGFMLGGAVHYQKDEYGTAATDELEVLLWTLDASAEFDGANLFAALIGRHFDSEALDADQYALVVQGGFYMNDDWELFARYEWSDVDMADTEDLGILTLGANRYFAGHNLKWTTDLGYAFDEVSAMFGDGLLGPGGDLAGWRTDGAGDDGQIVIRSQLQLAF